MAGNSGSNKSARVDSHGKGTKGSQPWFDKNLAKRRKANKSAKQARKRNRGN